MVCFFVAQSAPVPTEAPAAAVGEAVAVGTVVLVAVQFVVDMVLYSVAERKEWLALREAAGEGGLRMSFWRFWCCRHRLGAGDEVSTAQQLSQMPADSTPNNLNITDRSYESPSTDVPPSEVYQTQALGRSFISFSSPLAAPPQPTRQLGRGARRACRVVSSDDEEFASPLSTVLKRPRAVSCGRGRREGGLVASPERPPPPRSSRSRSSMHGRQADGTVLS
eukprot:TRINITY_DN5838_c0_g1_i1.p1 TRINITY_DN5838_c0_g1~~TRINITY_DN5838_c0_g1_i1.p1  ORF type:complete len:222 (+),score=16.38 TRINITY_DN5838_c0_g1_i1:306-971(+)